MPKDTEQPVNLVLEQLRLMRAEMKDRFDKIDQRFSQVDAEVADIKREVPGMKFGTIAEIYKANLTVASFADLERRVRALESKVL